MPLYWSTELPNGLRDASTVKHLSRLSKVGLSFHGVNQPHVHGTNGGRIALISTAWDINVWSTPCLSGRPARLIHSHHLASSLSFNETLATYECLCWQSQFWNQHGPTETATMMTLSPARCALHTLTWLSSPSLNTMFN